MQRLDLVKVSTRPDIASEEQETKAMYEFGSHIVLRDVYRRAEEIRGEALANAIGRAMRKLRRAR